MNTDSIHLLRRYNFPSVYLVPRSKIVFSIENLKGRWDIISI